MAIDSHMHINSIVSKNIEKEILDINNNSNLKNVINVSLNSETAKESIIISNSNTKFYSAIGIHPLYVENQSIDDLYDIALNEKVVAIGEIGLDTTKDNIELQKKYLIEQISIANSLNLPVIINANNSNSNRLVIEIFERYIKPKEGCVFHCFQPDIDDLNYLVKNNYYISFAGRITYKNAKKSLEVAKSVPNDLFLVETDSPYISPEPVRNLVNQSSNIKYIIEKLALIKDMSYLEIEEITTENTKRLFKKIN